jgi:hypothetical protein
MFVLLILLLLVLFFFKCEGRNVAIEKYTRKRRCQRNSKDVKSLITCRLAMGEWGVM